MLNVGNGIVNVGSTVVTAHPAVVSRGKAQGDHAAHQQRQQEFPSRIHGSSSSSVGVRRYSLLVCLPQVVLLLDILGQSCSGSLDIVWF